MAPPEQIDGDRAGAGAPQWHVHHLAETGSTNADLLEMAAGGALDRTVLVADHQTAGRGRLDRRWDAPPGSNLLVSLLFRDVPDPAGQLTQRVAVAATDACVALTGRAPELKWPNDLLLGDRKLAGILAQVADDGSVVVGLGLNVGWAPDGAAMLGGSVAPSDVLEHLLAAYDALPDDVSARYRERLSTLGRRVTVHLLDGRIDGTATGVEPDGRLVVVDECAITHRIDVGDVVHLRPGMPPT